jgi:hypothetical protein
MILVRFVFDLLNLLLCQMLVLYAPCYDVMDVYATGSTDQIQNEQESYDDKYEQFPKRAVESEYRSDSTSSCS